MKKTKQIYKHPKGGKIVVTTETRVEQPRTIRGAMLAKAQELTESDRQRVYGEASTNMAHFAKLLNAQFQLYGSDGFTAETAAIVMVLAKLSRMHCGAGFHEDNYVDAAAYAAIAGECCAIEGQATCNKRENEDERT